jgi:hypothetical protein
MASTDTVTRATAVEVEEVIVGVCHVQAASVFGLVVVRVTDERALPVVVHVSIGDGHEVLFGCKFLFSIHSKL